MRHFTVRGTHGRVALLLAVGALTARALEPFDVKAHYVKSSYDIPMPDGVQVQSSWFPVIDRNPQRFVDIMPATDADFQKATNRVYRSAKAPSHLTVHVLSATVP